jgi:hypothetical protein
MSILRIWTLDFVLKYFSEHFLGVMMMLMTMMMMMMTMTMTMMFMMWNFHQQGLEFRGYTYAHLNVYTFVLSSTAG